MGRGDAMLSWRLRLSTTRLWPPACKKSPHPAVDFSDTSVADRQLIHFDWKGYELSPLELGVIHHLLGVTEQHHGVVAEEQFVLDARVARAHPALDEQHGLGAVHVQDRHAEDRRLRIGLRRWVSDVVGADHEGDVGLSEFAVDLLKLEHLIVGNAR